MKNQKAENAKQKKSQNQSITTKDLKALSALMEIKGIEVSQETAQQSKKAAYQETRNLSFRVVSIVGYLIGVPEEKFGQGDAPLLKDVYDNLEKSKDARIIRNLCRIRNAMECNYSAIFSEFSLTMKNIGSLPSLIPTDAVEILNKDGIALFKSKPDIDEYLMAINQEISSRINSTSSLFPEWIKWEYVKPLFLMPDGSRKEGIKKAGIIFNQDRGRYPFQCWVNWDAVAISPENKGNILYNDEKLVTLLYERNEDLFENLSLVRDVGNQTMRNLHSLLEKCRNCLIAVDCENSDAVKLAAAISSLPTDQIGKIERILLFDSEYTTDQWKTLADRSLHMATEKNSAIRIEHIMVERLKQEKSLLDMRLAVSISREVFTDHADAVILVSSDSDYWAMIQEMKDVKFLVMMERIKTSTAIMDMLSRQEIPFCFIDDFCTSASYSIKTETLIRGIQEEIDGILHGQSGRSLNIREIMESTLHNSWITMTEKEKEAFYTRYLLHMNLSVGRDGMVSLQIIQ